MQSNDTSRLGTLTLGLVFLATGIAMAIGNQPAPNRAYALHARPAQPMQQAGRDARLKALLSAAVDGHDLPDLEP